MSSDTILADIISAAINFIFLGVGGGILGFFFWIIKRFIIRDASNDADKKRHLTSDDCHTCNEDRHRREEEMMQAIRTGYSDMKHDMRANMKDFKEDVRKDISTFKNEMRSDVQTVHRRFDEYLKDKKAAAMESLGS